VNISINISEVLEFYCLAKEPSASHTRPHTMKFHEVLSLEMVILWQF